MTGKKRPPFSEDWKRRIGDYHRGKPKPEEQRKKLAQHLSRVRYNASNRKPTGPEIAVNNMAEENIRYVGNGRLWVQFLNGRKKNPDFKVNGDNKVIEVFGDYWHRGENPYDLIHQYRDVGIDCLVIYESTINRNPAKVRQAVQSFIGIEA